MLFARQFSPNNKDLPDQSILLNNFKGLSQNNDLINACMFTMPFPWERVRVQFREPC